MKYPHLPALIVFSVVLLSCSDDLPVNSGSRGEIWGYVELYNEDGVVLNDHSDVSITLEGTTHSTISDASGQWRLKNVPAGVYTISFKKAGYSWSKEQIQYVGNGEYYFGSQYVVTIPTFRAIDFSITVGNNDQIDYRGTISQSPPPGRERYAAVYFSTDSTSIEKKESKHIGGLYVQSGQTTMTGRIFSDDFYRKGFSAGSVVYIQAYTANPIYTFFFDPRTKETINTNCSENGSPIVRFVVP